MLAESDDEDRPGVAGRAAAASVEAPLGAGGAPFIVGVVGKRDVHGLDAPLRAAFERVFDELDRRLPHTPKILVSALAIGADTIAAEAALGRAGWRIVAPLPFRTELYEADFKTAHDLQRLGALISDPRVLVRELTPLRRPGSGERYADDELRPATPSPPHRTLHYEQAGLFVVERAALLIAVTDDRQAPGRVGGTDRMLATRLEGPDRISLNVRARSDELLEEVGRLDPRTGPVWRIGLDGSQAALPVVVQLPGDLHPKPLGRNRATAESLSLGQLLDEFNVRSDSTAQPAESVGDAADRLADLRRRLTRVQALMKARVRRSVWSIAALFVCAIFSLETHIAFRHYDWAKAFAVAYFGFAVAAVALYVWAALRRWQPLAEDYRAVAEALRTQIVLWNAGLERRSGRVDLGYLRGMRGAFGDVRNIIGHLVEGARLLAPPRQPKPRAVALWLEDQFDYFRERIARRSLAMRRVQTVSWFLFVFGLTVSGGIAAVQFAAAEAVLAGIVEAPISVGRRWTLLAGELAVVLGLLALVWRVRVGADRSPRSDAGALAWRFSLPATAVLAGLIFTRALWDIAGLLPPPHHVANLHEFRVAQAEELMVMCAVTAAAVAGAIRFVADKLSLEAELQGFEHAEAYFARAREGLRQLEDGVETPERERDAILAELVEEALRESESWLFAHRERPLEPIMGG